MNQKELKELIDFLIEKDISEFELERGDVKVRIKRGGETAAPMITMRCLWQPCRWRPLRPKRVMRRRRQLPRLQVLLRLQPWKKSCTR